MIDAIIATPTSTIWAWSLVAGVAVILVVATLLILILVTARKIDYHANEIWEAGKAIAGNTVSIWMLQTTNQVAGNILEEAKGIVEGARSIDRKLGN